MRRIGFAFLILAAIALLTACAAPGVTQVPAGSSAPSTVAATAAAAADPATSVPPAATSTLESPVATATEPGPAPATSPLTSTAAAATTAADTPAAAPAGSPAAGTIRLTLQPDSQAGYTVREQLARLKLPSDAVGTTKAVTGALVVQSDGTVLSDQSKFTVDLSTLASDSGMRDGYIKRNTLQTDQYPDAVFVPTAVAGLPSPLPASGDVSFKLTGNLTVHGVTKPVTWDVQAQIAGNELTGKATTAVKFEDFGMTPPQTMMVLSVEDNIGLTIDFHMTAAQ